MTVTAWNDAAATAALMARDPTPAAFKDRREIEALGVTVVRYSNGVEAWFKPTDFKNDEVIFSLVSSGGSSLAPPDQFVEASLSPALVQLSGAGGHRAVDLQKLMAGKIASASPSMSASTHGISGGGNPANIETALQLLYLKFTDPGNDADAFALIKKNLESAYQNRERDPGAVFGEKIAEINYQRPLHRQAAHARPHRQARSRRDGRLLQGPLLECGGLHLLHGRRVQAGRGAAAGGQVRGVAAVEGRPAAPPSSSWA